jgi:hypothetical protein
MTTKKGIWIRNSSIEYAYWIDNHKAGYIYEEDRSYPRMWISMKGRKVLGSHKMIRTAKRDVEKNC